MPCEWNEVIASMHAYEGTRPIPAKGSYRQAALNEISEPEEFAHSHKSESITGNQLRNQPSARLKTGKTDHEHDFPKLRARFEKPNPHTSLPKIGGKDPPVPVDKGKGKEIDPATIEDEYMPLHNRWHEEYADIMGGTKPGLPPW